MQLNEIHPRNPHHRRSGQMKLYTGYNIMIACPSDIIKEKTIAQKQIYRWNKLYSDAYGIQLMMKYWEKDTLSQVGTHPQVFIDKELLEKADLLIAIFWSKIGTATLESISGVVHEIEVHRKNNKYAMLFFSLRKPKFTTDDPVIYKLELTDYEKVQELKQKFSTNSLYKSYSSFKEFEELIFDQLSMYINNYKDEINGFSKQVLSNEKKEEIVEKKDGNIYITSNNQSGGITAQNVNLGKQPRQMNNELGRQIKERVSTDSTILVVCLLGDTEGFNFATQALQWLKQNGYKNVDGVTQVVPSQSLFGQTILERSKNNYELVIGTQE